MLTVRVKPSSKEDRVEQLQPEVFMVSTRAPAKDEAANRAVIKLLADHLDLPKSALYIKRGQHSKTKIIDFNE